MKRLLLENAKSIPDPLSKAIDRLGALSAILGIEITAADADTVATVTITHSDTEDGTYTPVIDELLFLDATRIKRDNEGKPVESFVTVPVAAGELLNIDIDLIGCKQFVKIGVAYTADGEEATVTATYALALGDYDRTPPEA